MKVIVCGAGQVGFNIARHLALENNDVTVIDQDPELVRRVSDTLDAQGVVGHASNPDVLERAGIADADMIIAVTYVDEVNMVACQIAHSLFDVPTKIARVREQSYLQPIYANLFSRDHMPIDVIISPEIEVARAVTRRLEVPGAFEIPLAAKKLAASGRYAAMLALGCVIRGQTPHFDYIANEVTKGIAQISLATEIPIALGVITADTPEQAIERAGTKAGNKGEEAALAVIEMVNLLRNLD